MDIQTTAIAGVLVIQPKVFRDPRGYFTETFQRQRYLDAGITAEFVPAETPRACPTTVLALRRG